MQIMKGLEFCQKIDASIPVEYRDEFARIAPTFLDPFCSFMKEVRGPSYRPPKFENIDVSDKPKKTPLATTAEHDIIQMTQPSQHVSQTPTIASQPSSSRPEKLDVHRLRDRKWQTSKPLRESKEDIRSTWGWGPGGEANMQQGIVHKSFTLSAKAMLSLEPRTWIDDRIIYTYMVCHYPLFSYVVYIHCEFLYCTNVVMFLQSLLRDRDEKIATGNVFERKPTYYFMDPLFMTLARKMAYRREPQKLTTFYLHWATCGVGPTINKVDFIFFPTCVNENHWILFLFAVKNWGVVLLDPLYDDAEYPAEEGIMVQLYFSSTC